MGGDSIHGIGTGLKSSYHVNSRWIKDLNET
jgi:hypothetical protein